MKREMQLDIFTGKPAPSTPDESEDTITVAAYVRRKRNRRRPTDSEARQARDDAVAAVEAKATRTVPGWAERAAEYLACFSVTCERFTAAEFIAWAEDNGLAPPHDARAYGGAFQRLARRGIIKRVGYAPCPSRHMTPVSVWARVGR